MTQPAAGEARPRPRYGLPGRKQGNPADRARGETVRAVLAVTLKPGKVLPLETVLRMIQLDRSSLLRHLAIMQELGKLNGYSTANGVVRVW